MKKFTVIAILALLGLSATAYACQTYTYIINGKIITCQVCGTVTNCW